ncbi:MAG: Fis family transcriptional regulator [Myxococcaceae bacterium]|nr:Fis family transcriptional regulator [Myxococcaceae bacterium]
MESGALLKELQDETLPRLPPARAALEKARTSQLPQDVAPVRELLHQVAGSAAPLGLPQLSRLARFGEELAVLVLNGDAKTSDGSLTLLGRVLDAVEAELTSSGLPADGAPSEATSLVAVSPVAPEGPRPAPARPERPQVLMVDGDPVSVKLFTRVLVDQGFELRAMKAADAIAPIEEGVADVLLLDLSGGVTDASRAMVAMAKVRRMPVVAMSKLAREHESVAAIAREVDEYLTKPVAPEAMVAKVRAHAERRRAVRAARSRAPTSLTPALKPPPPPAGGVRVLVVDDSRVIRGLVREFLAESMVEVVEAEDGKAALRLLEELDRPPAAAVVDMQMPELDGLGLTRAMRRQDLLRGLPIVLLSAQDDPESQQAALEAGANAYLVKEKFDAPELRRALRKAGMELGEPV